RIGAGVLRVAVRPTAAGLERLDNGPARKKHSLFAKHFRSQGTQWGNIVDDPDTATVSCDDQVVVARMNCEIPNGNARQLPSLELGPLFAGVQGDPEAEFGSNKKKGPIYQIFLYDMSVSSHGAIRGDDLRPGLTEVGGLVAVGMHIA